MRTVVETVTVTHVIDTGTQGPPGTGSGGGSSAVIAENVSVWNDGDPQLVFTKTGDVVTNVT